MNQSPFDTQFDADLSQNILNVIDLLYTHREKNIIPELERTCKLNDLRFFDEASYSEEESSTIKKVFKNYFSNKPPVDLQFISSTIMDVKTQEKTIFLAFKGSKEALDWVTNFSIRKARFFSSDVNVHHGFQRSIEVFEKSFATFCEGHENDLFSKLYAGLKEENTKIILTGHSLGGALATLAACRFYDLGVSSENLVVYTFGAPPIGSKKFVQKYTDKIEIHRFVNAFDVVSHTEKMLKPFRNYRLFHLGEEIKLPSNEGEVHSLVGYIDNMKEFINNNNRRS